MNVRFAEGAVRCRVRGEELAHLLAGQALVLEVALPRDRMFRFSVRPSLLGQWQLDSDPTGIWLSIPTKELQALSERLPSREGLSHAFELASGATMSVSFEVDVKDKRSLGDRSTGQKSTDL
jgi:hypothetical protein